MPYRIAQDWGNRSKTAKVVFKIVHTSKVTGTICARRKRLRPAKNLSRRHDAQRET
jgi:hypothetical protein